MTVPPGFKAVRQSVTGMLTSFLPKFRHSLSKQESRLGVSLRGNAELFEALNELITSRIEARAHRPLPSTPQVCQVSMAMDKELQWLLSRLELVYHSPLAEAGELGEQPAA